MPRMACMATGRPTIVSCLRPAQSVHATGSSIACSKATWASSAAMRRIVAAGTPQRSATLSGDQASSIYRSAMSWNTGTQDLPATVRRPVSAGEPAGSEELAGAPVTRSQTSGRPSPSRTNSPSSGAPGSSITSNGALV